MEKRQEFIAAIEREQAKRWITYPKMLLKLRDKVDASKANAGEYFELKTQQLLQNRNLKGVKETLELREHRSPQEELFKFEKSNGVGIAKLQLNPFGVHIDGYFISEVHDIYEKLAGNDGLKKTDFLEWFKKVKMDEDLAIIHFTPFRYIQ